MGGVHERVDHGARDRHDPVPIARATLRDHLADLDEAGAALDSGDQARAASLIAALVAALNEALFDHLPDGRSPEEQDLAPL